MALGEVATVCTNLGNYLTRKGNEVIYNLDDDDIDVILLTELRKTSVAFTHIDILKYQHFVNNEVVVLHRINECDERKIQIMSTAI